MPSFQQQLRLKKNWGNTYRANLRAAVEALPKFVPMPPLSILRALPSVPLDSVEYNRLRDEMQAAFDEANEAIDSIRAAVVLLQATADYEFGQEKDESTFAVGEVLAEHSGCGGNPQWEQVSVRLNPGDKVVLVKAAAMAG